MVNTNQVRTRADGWTSAPGTWAAIASFALAVLATVLLVALPSGTGFVGVLLLPVAISLVPLPVDAAPLRVPLRIAAAVLLAGFVLLSLASAGLFYLPSAIAMGVAAARR